MIGIIASAMVALISVMVWYLKYQTKRQANREDKQDEERTERQEKRDKDQKEERDYYRNLITNDLHKNEELNLQSITLQKEMMKDFKEHGKHNDKISRKVVESLGLICNKLNGIKGGEVNERKK